MTRFSDLPDVLASEPVVETAQTAEQAAPFNIRPTGDYDGNLVRVVCRVYGKPGVPAMADLESRSVFPIKE